VVVAGGAAPSGSAGAVHALVANERQTTDIEPSIGIRIALLRITVFAPDEEL
jgi:hypothetical protein